MDVISAMVLILDGNCAHMKENMRFFTALDLTKLLNA